MAATKTKKKPVKPADNGAVESGEVLTLAEAAAYLRVSEDDVKRLVADQNLPGRFVGADWRFLKSAVESWLSTPKPSGKQAMLAMAGKFKDDPDLDEICREAYRRRGQSISAERP